MWTLLLVVLASLGRAASTGTARAVELKARYEGDGGPCEDIVRLTVVCVSGLTWEKGDPGNLDLDDCRNNEGMRVFPGKVSPEDDSPAERRKVKLVATVEPPVEGVTVHFKVWDVDDPFDQNNRGCRT